MDVYENIVIGNFLYSLGLSVGVLDSSAIARPTCINLLQQSPLDRALGDVMLMSEGVTRLIEFKRRCNDSDKEESKLTALERVLAVDKTRSLTEVSREIHWYVETAVDLESFVSRVVPYLDFRNKRAGTTSMSAFTSTVAQKTVSGVVTRERTKLYKKYLATVAAANGSFSGGSGALVVRYDEKHGLIYAVIDDLRDLLVEHRHLRDYHLNQAKEADLENQRVRAVKEHRKLLGLEMGKGKGRGYGR